MSKTESVAPEDILTDALRNSPRDMPTRERAQEMLDINMKYSACFHNRDYEGMEKCLIDSPRFEMQPLGLQIHGMTAYRERSKRLQKAIPGQLDPKKRSSNQDSAQQKFRSIAFGKDHMIVEWSSYHTMPDGSRKRCYTIAVIEYEGDKMVGERVYTCANAAELRGNALGADFVNVEGVTRL